MIRFAKIVEPAAADPAKLEKDRADQKAKTTAAAAKKRPAAASAKPDAGDDDKLL